jgi:hypothetical protein
MKFRRIIPATMLTLALAVGSCGTVYAGGRTSDEVIRKPYPKPYGYDGSGQKKNIYEQYERNAAALENSTPTNDEAQYTDPNTSINNSSLSMQPSKQVENTYTPQPHTTFGFTEKDKNQNLGFLSEYKNHIMVIAEVSLLKYYEDFETADNWTLMAYDEHNTVLAQDTVTINGKNYPYTYVGTFFFDSSGKITDIKTHLMKLGSDVIESDGYCKDVFGY